MFNEVLVDSVSLRSKRFIGFLRLDKSSLLQSATRKTLLGTEKLMKRFLATLLKSSQER